MTKSPRKPDPDLPAKRLARNQHDHVARFLLEEFVIGVGHIRPSALYKAYEWWCGARNVMHRALTPVSLLDHLKEVYGIESGNVRHPEDDGDRLVYSLSGLRFKHDPSLASRLRLYTRRRMAEGARTSASRMLSDDERNKRREHYLKHREEILAKNKQRRRQQKKERQR